MRQKPTCAGLQNTSFVELRKSFLGLCSKVAIPLLVLEKRAKYKARMEKRSIRKKLFNQMSLVRVVRRLLLVNMNTLL